MLATGVLTCEVDFCDTTPTMLAPCDQTGLCDRTCGFCEGGRHRFCTFTIAFFVMSFLGSGLYELPFSGLYLAISRSIEMTFSKIHILPFFASCSMIRSLREEMVLRIFVSISPIVRIFDIFEFTKRVSS